MLFYAAQFNSISLDLSLSHACRQQRMLFSRVQVGKGTSSASVVYVIVLSVNAIRSEEESHKKEVNFLQLIS